MGRKIGVFGNTQREAKTQLKKMLDDMKYRDLEAVRESPVNLKVIMKDGTEYISISGEYSTRGTRLDEAYVHFTVSEDFINNVIVPCLMWQKGDLEEKIIYYS